MNLKWALGLELTGVAVAIGCSLAELPLVSSQAGEITNIVWGRHYSPGDLDHYVLLDIPTPGIANPTQWYVYFNGTTDPAGPGPYLGQTVEVDYVPLAAGDDVLSVTAGPGLPDSVTYVTIAGKQFQRDQPRHYAALAGLSAGLLLTVAGAALVVRHVWRIGPRFGAVSTMLAPISLFGVIVPLVFSGSFFAALDVTVGVAALIGFGSALVAIPVAIVGTFERPRAFASYPLALVGAFAVVSVVWFINFVLSRWS